MVANVFLIKAAIFVLLSAFRSEVAVNLETLKIFWAEASSAASISAVFLDSHPKGTSTSLGVGVKFGIGTCRVGVMVTLPAGVGDDVFEGVAVELIDGVGVFDTVAVAVGVHTGVFSVVGVAVGVVVIVGDTVELGVGEQLA